MNERRRFLYLIGGSAAAVGFGCTGGVETTNGNAGAAGAAGSAGSAGAGAGGGTGGGTGGTGGTGGGTGGTGGTGGGTTTSTTCGGGGAKSEGTNNDTCQSDAGVFNVGKPSVYSAMGFHKVTNQNANVLIVRDAGGLYALSSLCTHQCCDMNTTQGGQAVGTVQVLNGVQVMKCNCHGSRFNLNGTVHNGPAGQALHAYHMDLGCDGILYVDTTKVVPNTQRLVA